MASGIIPGEFWSPCIYDYEKQVKNNRAENLLAITN
jgi:hypothetical protein